MRTYTQTIIIISCHEGCWHKDVTARSSRKPIVIHEVWLKSGRGQTCKAPFCYSFPSVPKDHDGRICDKLNPQVCPSYVIRPLIMRACDHPSFILRSHFGIMGQHFFRKTWVAFRHSSDRAQVHWHAAHVQHPLQYWYDPMICLHWQHNHFSGLSNSGLFMSTQCGNPVAPTR